MCLPCSERRYFTPLKLETQDSERVYIKSAVKTGLDRIFDTFVQTSSIFNPFFDTTTSLPLKMLSNFHYSTFSTFRIFRHYHGVYCLFSVRCSLSAAPVVLSRILVVIVLVFRLASSFRALLPSELQQNAQREYQDELQAE